MWVRVRWRSARAREERAGAGLAADALLRTSGRPWCPDML
ncbi:hypothetical protein SNL152K_5437 [Streptomyces sp. NL15-2K]|nr:hypothetical protein SNL152K_5437 [Streptomyces sp. NL15-2K]